MSEILNQDEIAALVQAGREGQLPEPAGPGGQRRGQRMRPVDFSRPTKFTSDQQRRISRATETFCQAANTRLSAELRWPLELELLNTLQLTWSAAHSQLPPGSLAVLLEVDPIGTRMLLTAERSFVLVCLECLLGGSPDGPARERRMSEIDWSLTQRLFESIVHPLSLVWQELGGVTLRPVEIDPTDAAQAASVSEPTFTVMLECRINRQSFALALLIPWIAIEPVAQQISGRQKRRRADEPDQTGPMQRVMADVPVTLRAEVASIDLEVQDILALSPGSVVRFDARAEQGVMLFAENVKLAKAHPGANGVRRAVQVSGPDMSRS